MTPDEYYREQLVTPPDGAERLTAALGGRQYGRHDEPPPFQPQPTGLEPVLQQGDNDA